MGKAPKGQASSRVMFPSTLSNLKGKYAMTTPTRIKMIDAYLLYILTTGIIQLVYCFLVGTFPFNSFLGGFISCVTSFIFGTSLRLHSNPDNVSAFLRSTPENAFAEFIFAHVLLHLAVINFIG